MAFSFCVEQRLDFRVRPAGAPMPALADDFALFQQHRADHRVRRGRAITAPRKAQRASDECAFQFTGRFFLLNGMFTHGTG